MLNNSFNAVEVLEMAKDIEKRGYDFYTTQAAKTGEDKLKSLFEKLAADEQDHYNRFVELIETVGTDIQSEAEYVYDQEVSAYLEAIVEFSIFPDGGTIEIDGFQEALHYAIYAEKDSILFYQEMLDYNQEETVRVLKKLIKEEKQHVLDLIKFSADLNQN